MTRVADWGNFHEPLGRMPSPSLVLAEPLYQVAVTSRDSCRFQCGRRCGRNALRLLFLVFPFGGLGVARLRGLVPCTRQGADIAGGQPLLAN